MGKVFSFVISKWKMLLNIVTLAALLITVYVIRGDLVTTFENLFHVHAWILLMIIPLEILNYHAQTKLYQHLFRLVGNKLGYKQLFLTALELNFVNHVFPSGGAAGISYFSMRLKSGEISGAKATLVQAFKLFLTFFSFEVLVLLSVILLAVGGKVNSFTMLIAGILITLSVVISILFIYIIGNKNRINAFLGFMTEQVNKIVQKIRPTNADIINTLRAKKVFDDFHESYLKLRNNRHQMLAPIVYALLMSVTEIMVIYVVFLAFGKLVNPGAIILAYGIANFAGTISILPGGEGIYEALMIAVLLATGVSAKISLPVIIMYRVLNTILQIPPGYYFYQKHLGSRSIVGTGVQKQ